MQSSIRQWVVGLGPDPDHPIIRVVGDEPYREPEPGNFDAKDVVLKRDRNPLSAREEELHSSDVVARQPVELDVLIGASAPESVVERAAEK